MSLKNNMFDKLLHFLFSPIRPLNVTSPIHHILLNNAYSNLWGWKPFSTFMFAKSSLRDQHTKIDVNERIIEVPWIFSRIDFQKKGKVLDVGWLESTVPISLATAGFQVTGIDIRENELTHPNLNKIVGDICESGLPSNTFDYVILLSTLEHIGLDTMYGTINKSSTDQKAINECLRVLKTGGKLLITTPVANRIFQNDFMRCYTSTSIQKLCKHANITLIKFYAPSSDRTFWTQVKPSTLPEPPVFGVALIEIVK